MSISNQTLENNGNLQFLILGNQCGTLIKVRGCPLHFPFVYMV